MEKKYMTINPDGDTNYFETKEAAVRALKEEALEWLYDECYFDESDFQIAKIVSEIKLVPFEVDFESEKAIVSIDIIDIEDQ